MMRLRPLFPYLLIFVACLAFVSVFSWTTSPIYGGQFEGIDSAVYKLVGKFWAEGLFPYVDIWDQKGPLIHAINALGYKCFGSDIGIFLIQIVSLYIAAIFIYKTLKLTFTLPPSLMLTCFIILSLSINYDGGDLVEEFLLPFISISYYYLLKYTISTNPKYSNLLFFCFWVGLSLAFSFFTRLTNALGVCASEFVICVALLYLKSYKMLIFGVLSTLLGFMVITIPVVCYFYCNSALNEMWYGTFGYNLEYAASMSSSSGGGSLFYFVTSYLNCFVLLIIAFLLFCKRKVFEGVLWMMTALLPLVWFIKGAAFAHYGMIVFQYLCISFVLLNFYFKNRNNDNLLIKSTICIIVIFVTMGISVRAYYAKNVFVNPDKQKPESYIERVCKKYHINKSSVILYNFPGPEYIENSIKPGMRFFYLHDFLMSHGSSIEPKMLKSFADSKINWIIAKDGVNNKKMEEYVNKHYSVIENEANVIVYKLNK